MCSTRADAIILRAGKLRHDHRLTPYEAAYTALWLAGANEDKLPELATQIVIKKELRSKLKGVKS